jgi:hypothetical protein
VTGEAFEEGQGPHRTVEPKMMMMIYSDKLEKVFMPSCKIIF